jgi:hypothetical protein
MNRIDWDFAVVGIVIIALIVTICFHGISTAALDHEYRMEQLKYQPTTQQIER